MTFFQICSAPPAVQESLRRHIDECAQRGKSFEFPDCQMPAGCVPGRAALGFARQGDRYVLYWRPSVSCQGNSRVLELLFSRNVWRFESFEAMIARLQSLRREVETAESRPPQRRAAEKNFLWPPLYCRLEAALGKEVLGQEQAVEAAAFRLYSHVGKQAPARPLSLIFYGPTGVGKSQLGKALAPALSLCCGRTYRSVWTELNTFTQPHAVHRLTGAPPGYVGYEDAPIFEAVRGAPYTVFMFDELEKAHPEVLKVFMSILDEGRCTAHRADDAGERELDFRRCVFVFTTNADLSAGPRRLGFSGGEAREQVHRNIKKAASPAELAKRLFEETETARRAMIRQGVLAEIAGRFGGIIGFHPLDETARLAITVKQIQSLGREYGLEISQVDGNTVRALTPGQEALSARSAVSVLESALTPLFTTAMAGGTAFRLSGLPGDFHLTPLYGKASNSSTVLLSGCSR